MNRSRYERPSQEEDESPETIHLRRVVALCALLSIRPSKAAVRTVFYAAKDGEQLTLDSFLSNLPANAADRLLNQMVEEEDGQRSTPLIIASRNGHETVVKLLVSHRVNIEQEGVVKIDEVKVEGATALWCAAASGHLKVVKVLIEAGAKVDHPTKSNSTPLRAACFDGRLDIVQYLSEHNADVHSANKDNNTCLMISAYKGHGDVVSYLLEKGADPNEKDVDGSTAFHYAAECGQLSIIQELVSIGAESFKNEAGMTPLLVAASCTREDVVKFLIDQQFVPYEEKIDALELLGASFVCDKHKYSTASAYNYMRKGMEMRFLNKDCPVLKKLPPPIPAYDNWVEAQNMKEMVTRDADLHSLRMESLAIRERILGQKNPKVREAICYCGAVYADCAQFDRCIQLLMHAVNLQQDVNVSVNYLLYFPQLFSQMIIDGTPLSFYQVRRAMELVLREIATNKLKLDNPGPRDNKETIQKELDKNLITMLYLLCISSKLLANHDSHGSQLDLEKIATSANLIDARTRDGKTLLHLCSSVVTPIDHDDRFVKHLCMFPCAATAKLLIQTGADTNAMDKNGNTPQPVIARSQRPRRRMHPRPESLRSVGGSMPQMPVIRENQPRSDRQNSPSWTICCLS